MKRCPAGKLYSKKTGRCISDTIRYRIEGDGKYWADDGSGRFGMPFSTYSEMRGSFKRKFKLKKVR